MADDASVRYRNAVLYDESGNKHVGDVLLHQDGGWSKSNGDEDVQRELDGSGRLITRSLQNWHTHLAMQLNARDFSDGFPLHRWLNEAVFPTEARLNPEYVRVGAQAAAAEMIRTGSSFAADMYFYPLVTGEILENAGLRGLVGGPVSDAALPSHPDAASALDELDSILKQQKSDDKIQYAIATHSVYLCSEDTLRRASELAEKRKARLHIHVSETRKEIADCHQKTGYYPVEYLNNIDFFKPGTVCAHASWVKKNEIRMLAEHGVTAVHCPSSNMKIACGGTMSLPAFNDAGVDVRIGTDGAASSGSGLNMLAEARLAALVQRHDHWDATLLPATDVFEMATKGSSDWAVWNLDDIRMRPFGRSGNRHLANLIFNGADCMDLWVDGQALRMNGNTQTIDEESAWNELDLAVGTYYEGVE
ncbi:MAG: amidohydrolase family protein [Euryarchaeota archaeon]|nr:amidohydrolase family protein [Euryarchaeota archaeon]MBT5595258.1 amidohydrolase family protein [Euryarchaeota archaeon]MBT6640342.1 amidohydrolase family protein [Euryarchaeota archaeon]